MFRLNSVDRRLIIIILVFSYCFISSIHANETIEIYADTIAIDDTNETVEATGDAIAVNENGIKMKSDKLLYNRNKGTLDADGNIIINDDLKNTFFFDEISASENMEKINGNNVKVRLNDGSRIVGSNFKKNGNLNVIYDAEFTPCKEDEYLIQNCPGWKLKSDKIYHDLAAKTIHHNHTQIQLFNIPVFYLPYFSHPDPSVKKRSGLLMPTIQTDNQLGDIFSQPIFLNLDTNKDITFTPNIQTSANNFYNLNYRFLNDNFNVNIDTSIDDNSDNSGTSNHLFFDSTIFNQYGSLNAYLKTSNNDTYMRKNNINNLTVLKSGVEFERETSDIFFSIRAIGYKHLTAQDEQWEYLYPNIVYNISNIDNGNSQGNVSLNNNLSIRKNLSQSYVSFASSQLDWTNQSINNSLGFKANNEANIRIISISVDEKSKKDTNNIRIYPQISSKISYPLIKYSSSINQTLTPIIMPIISPYNNYTGTKTVTNSNLFSSNRATSITEWEDGPRINYGLEWFINSDNGIDAKTIIGQNYRIKKNKSTSVKEISNYFINSNIAMSLNNYLDSSLIIDRDDLKTSSLNVNTFNEIGDLKFAINYDYTSGKYNTPSEQIAVGGKLSMDRDLYLKFTGAKNLDTNKNIGYQYGILYENDCLGIDFNYYRDLTKDRDIEESDGFSFTVVLKPFGSPNIYGKNIVFGPKI